MLNLFILTSHFEIAFRACQYFAVVRKDFISVI